MIKAESLENPERDLELVNREAKGGKKPLTTSAAEELVALRQRIATARATTPKDDIPHCGDCYRRGWAAALRALEG